MKTENQRVLFFLLGLKREIGVKKGKKGTCDYTCLFSHPGVGTLVQHPRPFALSHTRVKELCYCAK